MWMWAIQIFYIASKSNFQQARFAIDISYVIWYTCIYVTNNLHCVIPKMVSIWRLYEDIGLVVRQNTFDSMIWTVIKNLNPGSIFMPQISGSIAVKLHNYV